MNQDEQWLPIPGYKAYEVSNIGRVRSYLRPGGGKLVYSKPAPIDHMVNAFGYLTVNLMDISGSGFKKKMVHRLVAMAFLPDGNKPGYEVNHKDSNRGNPNLSNLEWVTRSENNLHAVKHGNGAKPKLNEAQREEVKALCLAGVHHAIIRPKFGISAKMIGRLSTEAKAYQRILPVIEGWRSAGLETQSLG